MFSPGSCLRLLKRYRLYITCDRGLQYALNFARMCPIFVSSLATGNSKASKTFVASSPMINKKVETLTSDSCVDIPVAISYQYNTFFQAFQFVAMVSSKTSTLGSGRFEGGMNICVNSGGKVFGAALFVVPPVAIRDFKIVDNGRLRRLDAYTRDLRRVW